MNQAAIPRPRVYLLPEMQPNAFATGRNPEHAPVAVTSGILQLLLALVAPIAATLIQLGISRSREYGADRTGAEISGDPEALARALEKLEQGAHAVPASMQPATTSLFIVNPFSGTPLDAGADPAPPRDAGARRRVAGENP